MNCKRLSLFTLGCRDPSRSRAFYRALGWREHSQSNDSIAFFQIGGAVLGLFGRAAPAEGQGRPEAGPGTGAMTLAQNFPTAAEVDGAHAAALGAGAAALKAPEPVFCGGYSGYWADPDGHVREMAMNPFWPLADDGSLMLPEPAA